MPIDPDELKVRRIKREQQVDQVQQYMEEQDALDKENATGKIGHHEVRRSSSGNGTVESAVQNLWDSSKK